MKSFRVANLVVMWLLSLVQAGVLVLGMVGVKGWTEGLFETCIVTISALGVTNLVVGIVSKVKHGG